MNSSRKKIERLLVKWRDGWEKYRRVIKPVKICSSGNQRVQVLGGNSHRLEGLNKETGEEKGSKREKGEEMKKRNLFRKALGNESGHYFFYNLTS